MKNLVLLFTLILFSSTIEAQTKLPTEHIVVIANVDNGEAKTANFSLSDLRIESKIKRAFKLDAPQLTLVNPTITNESGKGWFIQYEFKYEDYVGLWKEQLQLRNGQLVITESRNARIGISTNCQNIQFTNDENHYKCTEKKNAALEAEITFRLFSSMN